MTAAHPGCQFFLLIGSDNLPRLRTWHRMADLERLAQFVVLERGATAPATVYLTIQRHVDISATEIRNRVASLQSIRYLVPPPVDEIIQRHQLYQDPTRSLPTS